MLGILVFLALLIVSDSLDHCRISFWIASYTRRVGRLDYRAQGCIIQLFLYVSLAHVLHLFKGREEVQKVPDFDPVIRVFKCAVKTNGTKFTFCLAVLGLVFSKKIFLFDFL